jgi:type IV secretory pathway VirB10-like protein
MSTREQRAASREQRRAQSSEHDGVDAGDALKTAASAALAGAAVGAAHAFKQRRAARQAEDHDEPQAEEQQEPEEQEEQQQPEPEAQSEAEPEPEPQHEDPPPPPRPMRGGEAQRIVERAREEMRALRGEDAESVSSIRRTDNGWRVSLELVELHRVPDSTDVLGTYDVELDDDGNLVRFERTGRYYRSEADHRER